MKIYVDLAEQSKQNVPASTRLRFSRLTAARLIVAVITHLRFSAHLEHLRGKSKRGGMNGMDNVPPLPHSLFLVTP
jgi:hypothetical protein